ncbi:MAG TPA: M20/M25/M40 family metallo-hydrolase [Longimicrobiales bacterium]|nr:M20/M25/M40 family metallo-hydrolase [Longimicrobiales bacterium]
MNSTPDLSFERAIGFAQDLIRIPGAPGAEGDVAARVMRELVALGFHDVRSDEVGNVIGVAPGTGAAPPVMVCSHMDVVDVGDPASWEHAPYEATIADGHLHGRGAMDIKGPLALQTYAAARFLAEPAAGDVVVAHTVLEERGGWGMAHLMAKGEVRPGAVIIGESTNGDICIGHRGRAEIIVELQGLAGHASAPERARNPLYGLGRVLDALQHFAASLTERDAVLGTASAAPTMVETLPGSRNVIPDRARVVLDWRVLPGLLPDAALDMLREHLHRALGMTDSGAGNAGSAGSAGRRDEDHAIAGAIAGGSLPEGVTLDVRFATEHQHTWTGLADERRLFTPGYLLDADHAVPRAAAKVVTRATGRAPQLRPWTFATDGGHSCGVHGIPTIGFAPGEERYAHTNRERLELETAQTAYAAYPDLIRAVANALG